MGSPAEDRGYADAIFVSPHKFIGGPGTPGVLVARSELFRNRVPSVPGGGTVEYVNPSEHVYVADVERREEGGTPDIVGSIRAGLVFRLKDAVGTERSANARSPSPTAPSTDGRRTRTSRSWGATTSHACRSCPS